MEKAKKKVVMIDNFDSFTYNLVDYLKQTGAEVVVFRNTVSVDTIRQEQPDIVVYSPGPGNPSQAGNLLQFITELAGEAPQFGVCLGMQAMAEAFGGSLLVLDKPMHGKSSVVEHDGKGVFAGLGASVEVGRYHSLAVQDMPDDFELTAHCTDEDSQGNTVKVVMAMRHTSLPIAGVQFHPESVLTFKNQAGVHMISNLISQL